MGGFGWGGGLGWGWRGGGGPPATKNRRWQEPLPPRNSRSLPRIGLAVCAQPAPRSRASDSLREPPPPQSKPWPARERSSVQIAATPKICPWAACAAPPPASAPPALH